MKDLRVWYKNLSYDQLKAADPDWALITINDSYNISFKIFSLVLSEIITRLAEQIIQLFIWQNYLSI